MDANTPKPRRRRRSGAYQLRVWSCGYCNTRCKTVLAPGGLCALCRGQQPSLFDPLDAVDDSKGRP